MKVFVVVLALVAAVAGDVSILQPNSHLQPPVERLTSKDFNTPWVEENAWRPAADPHQPIHVPQEGAYYTQVQYGSNNQDCQQDQYQYQPNEQIEAPQQSSYYTPVQHGSNNQDYQQDQHQYQPRQQVNAPQQSSHYASVQHGNNNQDYQQDQHQYKPHQQIEAPQQNSHNAPVQHGNSNQDYQLDQHQYQPHQQMEAPQQSSYYAQVQHGNYNQDYQQQHHHHQEHQQQQQGHSKTNNAPSSVAVQVTHPDWAMSFSNVNRYKTNWSVAAVAPVMVARVPFRSATPAFAAPAPFSKPTQAPVAVYNNNVAKWNPWNNNQHSHQHQNHQHSSRDIAKVPLSVAKYVAITPGSIHIAPLPGHTVSHKFLNLAAAGSW